MPHTSHERLEQVNLVDGRNFIRSATRPQSPPRVPEVRLWLADEMTPIWQLTEEQLGTTGIDPPFWAFAWAGGQAVARHLLDAPIEVVGKRVLDLASGSGMVAIAALLAGAESAVSLDIDPIAGIAAGLNAECNGVEGRLRTVTADVLDGLARVEADVVVAGDVCYDRDMTPRVLSALAAARSAGARVLLGDPGRTYLPRAGLDLLATYDVPTTADLEGREICPSSVFELR